MTKSLGKGTISLFLLVFGIFISFVPINKITLGDRVIESLGVSAWSSYVNGNGVGLHYGAYLSLLFLIPAYVIARKYINDFGAKISKTLTFLISLFLILVIPYFFIISFLSNM